MDIEAWLKGLGLEVYAEAFAENDVDAQTLARLTAGDLKDIGAIKTGRGYELPNANSNDNELKGVNEFIRGVTPAGPNLTVIKTAIGAAQRVALALDRSDWPEMIGNIGGDDTVFVASDSSSGQKILIAKIERARA